MPYQNEHSARLQPISRFDPESFRRKSGGTLFGRLKLPKSISVIYAKLKLKNAASNIIIAQSLRFDKTKWTASEAKEFLKTNKIKIMGFEAAKE